jgi:hypothetical protein
VDQRIFEWAGCVFGLIGAGLLALNIPASRYGWFGFALANAALILYAWQVQAFGLLVQQIGFSLTSALGIYRAFRHSDRAGLP